MDVFLYNTASPPNKVSKTLEHEQQFTNVIFKDKGSLSVVAPEVVIKLSGDVSRMSEYNYMKIPKFGSFYYIEDIRADNNLVTITGKRDPLMTFKKDILASTQYVLRNENKNNNPYIADNEIPVKSQHNYYYKPFGDDVDDRHCINVILETSGKGRPI